MYQQYDLLIKKLAHECLLKLPSGYTSLDDLEQEARIVLMKLRRKRYKPSMGKFITILTKSIKNQYAKIVRDAYTTKRGLINFVTVDPVEFETYIHKNQISQDVELERKEILNKLREIDSDVADLIEFGVPDELFAYARKTARKIAVERKRKRAGLIKINKIIFSKSLLEKFYKVDFDNLIKTLHSGK